MCFFPVLGNCKVRWSRWARNHDRDSTETRFENRSLPSSKNPHFENEARRTTFLVKMSFCMRMKYDFHIKGWAPTLVLKQRPGETRKWLIVFIWGLGSFLRSSRLCNYIFIEEIKYTTSFHNLSHFVWIYRRCNGGGWFLEQDFK